MEPDFTLDPQQTKICEQLLRGLGNKEIARELRLRPRTIKRHLKRMFSRFEIWDGHQRVKLAVLLSTPLARAAMGLKAES